MSKMISISSSAMFVVLLATAAQASSVHFKQNRPPSFIDGGLTLQASGALAGLGNTDIAILLSATANVTATCTNPGGEPNLRGRIQHLLR
jgi:hypothetical protein